MRVELAEWMPLKGDYRSGPVRPRWDGPGWGTVVLAGTVVAAMGWAVLADGAEKEALETGGAATSGREATAVVVGAEPREQVPVSWERKTGEKADEGERPHVREAERTRAAEPAVKRTKAVPEKRERHSTKPERRAGHERAAKRARHVKRVEWRRADVRPFERGRLERRGAVEPPASPLSGLAGRECERQLAGVGPFCSMVLDRIFADGQAHGGR